MDFKQELASHWRQWASTLTEKEALQRIDQTISSTFAWVGGLLLLSFWIAYATAFGYLPLPVSWAFFMWSRILWLALIFFISWKRKTLSYNQIAGLLTLFAFLEWYGLTWVFLSYSMGNIYNVFLTTWAAFGVLSVIWYRTDINITKVWPLLFAALIGLIIAIVVNMFVWSSQFDFWISIFGLVIFGAFVVYDMNVLKVQALSGDERTPLLMALGLFINFINIFLFLLRLMWGQD